MLILDPLNHAALSVSSKFVMRRSLLFCNKERESEIFALRKEGGLLSCALSLFVSAGIINGTTREKEREKERERERKQQNSAVPDES